MAMVRFSAPLPAETGGGALPLSGCGEAELDPVERDFFGWFPVTILLGAACCGGFSRRPAAVWIWLMLAALFRGVGLWHGRDVRRTAAVAGE